MGRRKKKPPLAKAKISEEALEKLLLKGFLLFFAVVLIYIPAMNGGYIYDDDQLLTQNPNIQRGVGFLDLESWHGLRDIWLPFDARGSADYFPASSSALWLEWRLWGNNEPNTPPEFRGIGGPGYHVTNILLHGCCVVLLWAVLAQMRIPGAWVASLIWGIHPVGVETVAWISELKNTLSMLLFLLMMLAWLKYQKSREKSDYRLTVILFTIALLAKSAIVMVPFVLLLHVWWDRRTEVRMDWRQGLTFFVVLSIFAFWIVSGIVGVWTWYGYPAWRFYIFGFAFFVLLLSPVLSSVVKKSYMRLTTVLQDAVPFFAIAFVFGIVTLYFQNARAIGQEYVPIGGPSERFTGACFALGFYLYKTFLPFNLVLIYPQWHNTLPKLVQVLPGLGFAGMFYWAWRRRTSWGRHVIFGMGFFVIMLWPILGFLKMAYMRLTLVADHFQYTPMVGVIALSVAGLIRVRDRLRPPVLHIFYAAGALVLGLFCVLTWERAIVFHEKELLWVDTLNKNPESWQAHSHLGAILFLRGDFDGALKHWKRSTELKPYLYEVHNNYGLALGAKGRLDEALEQFKRAVEIDGDQPAVRSNYADSLRMARRFEEAIQQYREVLRLTPGNPAVYLNMGVAFFTLGKIDDAIACFEEALRLAPGYTAAQRDLDAARHRKQEMMGIPMPGPVPSPGTPSTR